MYIFFKGLAFRPLQLHLSFLSRKATCFRQPDFNDKTRLQCQAGIVGARKKEAVTPKDDVPEGHSARGATVRSGGACRL
jgi:hypothetical protein